MSQKRSHSLLESVANTAIGYAIAYLGGLVIYPLFNVEMPAGKLFWVTLAFTALSIARGYLIRRFFNKICASARRG